MVWIDVFSFVLFFSILFSFFFSENESPLCTISLNF